MNDEDIGAVIESYGISDIGLVRSNNEDVWTILSEQHCFILADGMGGHQAGEVAAQEAVSYLSQQVKTLFSTKTQLQMHHLEDAIQRILLKTNTHVYSLSLQDKALQGMGTTLCMTLVIDATIIYAHIGDSRIYRVRRQRIDRLTQDHSLRDEMLAKGELSPEMIINFPYKNVITRAIGTHAQVIPEIQASRVLPGDIYFLCSDGLTDSLSDAEILSIILESPNIKEAADSLVREAKLMGGNDNITIIIFKILN